MSSDCRDRRAKLSAAQCSLGGTSANAHLAFKSAAINNHNLIMIKFNFIQLL